MSVGISWWGAAAVATLAGLDLAGAVLAKEYALRPRWLLLVAGVATFALLFIVYVISLSVSELWVVTFGWVVLLEVGVLVIDRVRFSTAIPPHKLVLAGLLVTLQLALMLTDRIGRAAPPPKDRPAAVGAATDDQPDNSTSAADAAAR